MVFGYVLIPNLLVKMYIGHDSLDIAFSSSALYCVIKTPIAGGVRGSGWCLECV